MTYKTGSLEFKTKKESEIYTRSIINNIGENNINNTHKHFQFLVDLLNNHHKKDSKIGCGVDSFIITKNARGTGYEVQIRRIDDTTESFSWKDCANHTHKNEQQLLEVAMRTAIDSQVQEFRNSNLEQCANPKCKKIGKCDVDHIEPFNNIKNKFLSTVNNGIPSEFDKQPNTHQHKFRECDADFESKWQLYHKLETRLQYLCYSCHKEKTKNDIKMIRG